jgi:hypothetical protein
MRKIIICVGEHTLSHPPEKLGVFYSWPCDTSTSDFSGQHAQHLSVRIRSVPG